VLPTVSKGIDTKRLKEEMPEVAEKYEKLTEKKGFIKLTIK
jgi:predicted phage-related endonuclease